MSIFKKVLILFGDFLILYLSLVLMLVVRYGLEELRIRFGDHLLPFTVIIFLWLIIFYLSDFYHQKNLNQKKISKVLGTAVIFSLLASVIIFYLFGEFFKLTPKTNLLIFGGVFFALDLLWRVLIAKFFTSGALGIVILGDSPLILETINYIKENPQTGYKTVLWLKEANQESVQKIEQTLKNRETQVIVAVQRSLTKELMGKLMEFLSFEANFIDFGDFYEMIFEKVPLEELEESWFVKNITARRPVYDHIKRFIDLALSLLLGILFLPLSFLIALTIKLSSHGPVIYWQKRVGKNGKVITIHKFRTMTHENVGLLWTEENDNRVTQLGKILRFTHLDEIPQLWNIIRGDISFTGPRPERTELAKEFEKFPYYDMRHIVKPGLTGWAQINYKASASLEEAYEKLRYDIFYVKNRSFWLDIRIIIKTIRYLFMFYVK